MSSPFSSWYRTLLDTAMCVPQHPALSNTFGGLFCSSKLASSLLRTARSPLQTAVPAMPAPKPTMPKMRPCCDRSTTSAMLLAGPMSGSGAGGCFMHGVMADRYLHG